MTQVLRKLTRDIVISVTHKPLVGVYFVYDEEEKHIGHTPFDGREVLMECSPHNADQIIELWNSIVDDESE